MKKYIFAAFYFLMIFLFNSCQQQVIFISGTVEGSDSTVIAISDYLVKDTPDTIVVKNGTFSHKIQIDHPGYYYFSYGEEVKMIFLNPGYNLKIHIQETDSITNYTFEGKGDIENNTLQRVNKDLDNISVSFIRELPFSSKMSYIDSLFTAYQNNFVDSIKHKKIDPIYVNFQKKYFEFNGAMLKTYFNLQEETRDPQFIKYLETLEFDNCQFLGIPVFRGFLDYHTEYLLNQKLSTLDSIKKSNHDIQITTKFEIIKEHKNKIIREYLMFTTLKQIIDYEGIEGFKIVKSYYDEFVLQDKYRDHIHIMLNKKLEIGKGKTAFNFIGIDRNEKVVQLSDFKGKIVYIDFWATWCRPCREEAPFYNKLSKEYNHKGIQFVSISINDETEIGEWKEMIKGDVNIIHLRISKDKLNELLNAYQIKGVPTYMLIDQNGNFINSAAPRPSSTEIRSLLDQLIVK